MEILIGWVVLSFLVAAAASARGRSSGAWFVISCLVSPLFGILLLIAFPVRDRGPSTRELLLDARRKDEHPDGPIRITPENDR